MLYRARQKEPRPLIVSLHTWSGDYLQEDPLAEEILLRDWNYIHPDFRGPNNQPEACGSEQVIYDIEDAIQFAIEHAHIDPSQVHIIGVSGGGYTTQMSYFKLNYPVKSFHAWAPVTNLVDWYWECTGRGLEYARDLEEVTTGGNGFNPAEARKRSPELMQVPDEKRNNATLCIYAGVHDGFTGSVPVSHSINMYNNLVRQIYPVDTGKIVSDSLMLVLLEKRMNQSPDTCLYLGDRKVYLYRELPRLRLTIFEGGHEMIAPEALSLLPVNDSCHSKKLNILTIGDSNGPSANGWPAQLKKLLVLALCLFAIQGLSAQEEEMKSQKYPNVDYSQVVYVKFLPGKIERAKEIISKFESAGEGIMEAPQTHWFMTGEYDAMFIWHMKDGPAEMEWKYSEEGIQGYQAFIKQEGSAEAARKLNEEYVSLISYSNSALSMKER